jgi:hypothetical protein
VAIGEEEGPFPGDAPREAESHRSSTQPSEQAALQDPMEVEHEIEAARAQGAQEAECLASERETVACPQRLDEIAPREDQRLVDDARGLDRPGGQRLDEPGEMCTGVESTESTHSG